MYPWLEPAWEVFMERLSLGRMPHALLLKGPGGCGKTRLARQMTAHLLCLEASNKACGACRSCRLFAGGAHPDLFLLRPDEGKHTIRVDAVRSVIHSLTLTVTISRRKVALIEPAEAMNESAANALLKTLEEPPGDAVIVLLSHDPSRLPVTIRSRCQFIDVALPEAAIAAGWLRQSLQLDERTAQAALAAAGGSPLRAAEYARSDLVEAHQAVQRDLAAVLRAPHEIPVIAPRWEKLDPGILWLWLDYAAADAMRAASCGGVPEWLGFAGCLDRTALSDLQQLAGRCRALARTGVRKDLLLRDWLIKWAAQENLG